MHDPSSKSRLGFEMREQRDDQDAVRLALSGELDLAVAQQLETRLRALARTHTTVVLDLSDLEFIDCTGIHVLITYFNDAAHDGWNLRVDTNLTSQVQQAIELVGLDHILWP